MKHFSASMIAATVAAAVLIGCVCWVIEAQASPIPPKFVLRVNAGDTAKFTDHAGNVWQPDKYYTKGSGYGFVGGDSIDRGASTKIEGTTDPKTSNPKIYQTEHYSMDAFKAEVPNGKYTVRLHFAETYEDIATDGPRVFDVKIQGNAVLKDFDPAKAAGGQRKPIVKEYKGIDVTNGILEIGFEAKVQNPEINGIEIISEF
jgi:endoglucanase